MHEGLNCLLEPVSIDSCLWRQVASVLIGEKTVNTRGPFGGSSTLQLFCVCSDKDYQHKALYLWVSLDIACSLGNQWLHICVPNRVDCGVNSSPSDNHFATMYPKTTHPRDPCCNMRIAGNGYKGSRKRAWSPLPPGPDPRWTSPCNRERGRGLPRGVLLPTWGRKGLALLPAVGYPVINTTRITCLSVWVHVPTETAGLLHKRRYTSPSPEDIGAIWSLVRGQIAQPLSIHCHYYRDTVHRHLYP